MGLIYLPAFNNKQNFDFREYRKLFSPMVFCTYLHKLGNTKCFDFVFLNTHTRIFLESVTLIHYGRRSIRLQTSNSRPFVAESKALVTEQILNYVVIQN